MYAGGPRPRPGTDRARTWTRAPSIRPRCSDGLAPMLRFRWAVQANYFAWRIAENNLTGISGPQDNEKGLEDARRALL